MDPGYDGCGLSAVGGASPTPQCLFLRIAWPEPFSPIAMDPCTGPRGRVSPRCPVLIVALFVFSEWLSDRMEGREVDAEREQAAKRAAAVAKGKAW